MAPTHLIDHTTAYQLQLKSLQRAILLLFYIHVFQFNSQKHVYKSQAAGYREL